MICKNCTKAGRLNNEVELVRQNDQLNLLAISIEVRQREVEELHKQCANLVDSDGMARQEPTMTHCDCHHRTGSGYINRDGEGNAVRST
jgi:hypothetical protein